MSHRPIVARLGAPARTGRLLAAGAATAIALLLAAGCSSSAKSAATQSAASHGAGGASASSASANPAPSGSTAGTGAQASSSGSAGGAAPATSTAAGQSAKLAAIVLKASDLPAGWTSTPHKQDPQDSASQAALVKCVGGRDTTPDQSGEVNSPDFGFNGATVSSSADSYRTQADLAADTALIRSPKLPACFEQSLKTELEGTLPAGSSVDSATFAVTAPAAGSAANVIGIGTGAIVLTAAGKQVPVYVKIAFISGPLTEAELDVENPNQPVPAAFFATLTQTVAARAAKA